MTNTNPDFLLRKWHLLADMEKRLAGEDGFLGRKLKEHNCSLVYDLCLGGGIESIDLLKRGFNVVSNELDSDFIDIARENAKKHRVNLDTGSGITHFDWRRIPYKEMFDGAIMIGNSLVYIHDESEQQQVLDNICGLLRPGGIFIIDHRNFEYIFSDAEEILKGRFKYSGKYNYTNDRVKGYPVHISPRGVMFEYLDILTGEKGYLDHYPIFEDKLKRMLYHSGFKEISTYYDYRGKKPEHHDFVQHVALK